MTFGWRSSRNNYKSIIYSDIKITFNLLKSYSQILFEFKQKFFHEVGKHTAISRHADIEIPVPSINFNAYSFFSDLN